MIIEFNWVWGAVLGGLILISIGFAYLEYEDIKRKEDRHDPR